MPVKVAAAKRWAGWIRGADGVLRSDDPYGLNGGATPTLPTTLTTTYSLPAGNTWTATNTSSSSVAGTGTGNRTDCSLNYALTNCARGDIIVLTKGATYTGTYTIPNKTTGSGWIYVVSSGDPGIGGVGLPAAGTRVAPGDATSMPLMVAPSATAGTIDTVASAHHFRFVGIEIKSASTNVSPFQGSVVSLSNNDTSNSTVCDNIIFDRCYVHGSGATQRSGRRGFMLCGTNLAVIDSYISGFYDDGYDSQGILGYQGDGPYKIVNNYVEAASENIMFGGVDPTITNSIPSNIEVRHNHLKKLTAWIGAGHNVKNNFELKNAQRVLVEGNILENCWTDGQTGFGLLLTPRNQSGGASWCKVSDVTIRKNKFLNVGAGMTISGEDDINTSQRGSRFLIEDNLMDITDPSTGATNRIFNILNAPSYLTIRNNTALLSSPGNMAYSHNIDLHGYKADNFVFQDNIFTAGSAEFFADGNVGADATLPIQYSSFLYRKNVVIGGVASRNDDYGTNYVPANNAAVGFTNIAGAFSANDYTLTGASAYHNAGTDGTDIGCDIAAMNAAVN